MPGSEGTELAGVGFETLKQGGVPLRYFAPVLSPLAGVVADFESNPAGVPVLGVNSVTLADGKGVVVGMSVQHNMMDAIGMFELVRLWGDCVRADSGGDDDLSTAPDPQEPLHRDRLLRRATSETRRSAEKASSFHDLLARHREFSLRSAGPQPRQPQLIPPSSSQLFNFDSAKLDNTKLALRALAAADPSLGLDPALVTTNNVLCAIAWSCITRIRTAHRGAPDTRFNSKLFIPVNGRTRILPNSELAGKTERRPFLGNVILVGMAGASTAQLAEGAAALAAALTSSDSSGGGDDDDDDDITMSYYYRLATLVKPVAAAIARVTPAFIAEVLELAGSAPVASDVAFGWDMSDRSGGWNVSVSSWANMGVYEAEFGSGVGRLQSLRVPEIKGVDRCLVVVPRKREGGWEGGEKRIEVVVCLCEEDLEALGIDGVWTKYLQIA
ncbi:hypothetical protein VTI74DRAFT_5605 [Chaetomium olivicolor]